MPGRSAKSALRACRRRWAIVAPALLALAGCATTAIPSSPESIASGGTAARSYEGLDASLWIQTSEEARLLRQATYAAATRALAAALAEPSRSAFGEADPARPPAAVLDLDETVLDNSAYNAALVVRGERFGPANWSAWVEAAEAKAVPGALEFAHAAAGLGVELFYVSNRDAPMEAATRANLRTLGFPLAGEQDSVLLRGERPEWRSDKSSRYAEVARSHRILVLIGDDLNDFVPVPAGTTLEARGRLAEPYRERFGRDWFLLPNPVHGSWMRAAVAGGPEGDPATSETERKLGALEIFDLDGPPD